MRHACAGTVMAAVLIAATTSAAFAQSEGSPAALERAPQLMGGYVINGPDQLLGAGLAWMPAFLSGWGVYLDFKTDIDPPTGEADFVDDLAAEEAEGLGDGVILGTESYRSVNIALVRAYSPQVSFYLGAGVTEERAFGSFSDPLRVRSELGQYWAEYEDAGGSALNVLGGLFIRIGGRAAVQFGGEVFPAGMTIGLHLVL